MYVTFNSTHLVIAHIVSVSNPTELFAMGGNSFRVEVKMSNGDEHAVKFDNRNDAQVATDALIKALTA